MARLRNADSRIRDLERRAALGDPEAQARLAAELGRTDPLEILIAGSWAAATNPALPTWFSPELSNADFALHLTDLIPEALDAVNGRRRERVLDASAAGRLILRAAETDEPQHWCQSVANAYRYRAYTTTFLAAPVLVMADVPGFGVVPVPVIAWDATLSPARHCSPGRAWPELQPWGRGRGHHQRIEAWALNRAEDAVPLQVVPLLLTSGRDMPPPPGWRALVEQHGDPVWLYRRALA